MTCAIVPLASEKNLMCDSIKAARKSVIREPQQQQRVGNTLGRQVALSNCVMVK